MARSAAISQSNSPDRFRSARGRKPVDVDVVPVLKGPGEMVEEPNADEWPEVFRCVCRRGKQSWRDQQGHYACGKCPIEYSPGSEAAGNSSEDGERRSASRTQSREGVGSGDGRSQTCEARLRSYRRPRVVFRRAAAASKLLQRPLFSSRHALRQVRTHAGLGFPADVGSVPFLRNHAFKAETSRTTASGRRRLCIDR